MAQEVAEELAEKAAVDYVQRELPNIIHAHLEILGVRTPQNMESPDWAESQDDEGGPRYEPGR